MLTLEQDPRLLLMMLTLLFPPSEPPLGLLLKTRLLAHHLQKTAKPFQNSNLFLDKTVCQIKPSFVDLDVDAKSTFNLGSVPVDYVKEAVESEIPRSSNSLLDAKHRQDS